MKIINLLLMVFLLVSCAAPEKKDINISFRVAQQAAPANDRATSLVLINNKDQNRIELIVPNKKTVVETIDKEGYYTLQYKGLVKELYLSKGTDLTVVLVEGDKGALSAMFKGDNKQINNYLNSSLKEDKIDLQQLFGKEEHAFLEYLNNRKKELEKTLKTLDPQDQGFLAKESRNIRFSYLNNIYNYKKYHSYVTKNDTFKVSESFQKQIDGIDFNDENNYGESKTYRTLVQQYYSDKIVLGHQFNVDTYQKSIQQIEGIEITALKNSYYKKIGDNLLGLHNFMDGHKIEALYQELIQGIADSATVNGLQRSFEKNRTLYKGNLSPQFAYENNNGQKVSLKDFKGKYVYIDIWATWCIPCIEEFPDLKKLKDTYKNKNIAFIGLSTDKIKDKPKWKNKIKKYTLKGTQLIADNAMNSDFILDYNITGIPRFILLDPNGNIISADAPKPSSTKEITGLLNRYIAI